MCVWVVLFVVTACVVGYMVVNGTALGCVSCAPSKLREGNENMSESVYATQLELDDAKTDLEDIRTILNGHATRIDKLDLDSVAGATNTDTAPVTKALSGK